MTLLPEPTATQTQNEEEVENTDPFIITPPRKSTHRTQTTTPATPKSKANTPLHKRFLEEVTMSPGTPPRTPSRSPKTGGKEEVRLEVGQNGFYFSMEIPERKIVGSRPTSRAATPDAKPSGRVTPGRPTTGRLTPGGLGQGRLSPSPKKDVRSEVKGSGTGRVKDILRKNLFGTPTKKGLKMGWGAEKEEVGKGSDSMSPSKEESERPVPKCELRTCEGSGSQRAQNGNTAESASEHAIAPSATQDSITSTRLSSQPVSTTVPPTSPPAAMSLEPQSTPKTTSAPVLNVRTVPSASTPSNIGHLMANHSNKSAKVQTLPTAGGLESMPTPLRKMQEKLGLRSPHVLRKERSNEDGSRSSTATSNTGTVMSPVSVLAINGVAPMKVKSTTSARAGEAPGTTTAVASDGGNVISKEARLTQLRPSPITIASSTGPSRPSTATTPSFTSPLTPSRPGLSSRSKSFGTPARLRSSMQEDMFKVQESLKRSLGQEAFQKTASRPATPMSPTVVASRPSTSATNNNTVKQAMRPVSTVGPPKSNATSTTQVVPRRPLNTAACKPRPKSMIVGSAKVLETIASQIDSPRERAKLRSTATASTAQHGKPTASRPGTASTSRASKPVAAVQKPEKPVGRQPTVRKTKSAALRAAAQPKRAALSTPTAVSGPARQRVVSAEVIADRVAAWAKEDSQQTAPKPAPKLPVRSTSVKTLRKPAAKPAIKSADRSAAKQSRKRAVKTPEPKDTKADSGTAQSFTPPGLPTQLPMSPSKKLLFAPAAAVPALVPKPTKKAAPPPSATAQLRAPLPAKTPARTPANKRHTWVDGMAESDPNALRTPSKEIQSALDKAIDRKIWEDRRRAGWI